jgi:putative ABC transport system permease protein
MNYKILSLTAIKSLNHHKGRSLLTMLGIIIGIAAIITIMAIGKGAEKKINQKILSMGDNSMFIHPGNWLAEKVGKTKRSQPPPQHFKYQDLEALKKYVPSIKRISPFASAEQVLSVGSNQINTEVKAGNYHILEIGDKKIKRGQNFNPSHLKSRARVTIIGPQAAKELFKNNNPIGKTIQIAKNNFIVIGIFQKIETYFGMRDPNLNVYIPITSAQSIGMVLPNRIKGISLSLKSLGAMQQAKKDMRKVLRARRHIRPSDPDDFMIWDQASMLNAAQTTSSILTLLLLIIASISLLVGGIGVMNIMLVSITERTQEIGIRMALGATTKTILQQFLLESLILCSLGGLTGIIFGVFIPLIVKMFTGWLVVITPTSIIASCVTIGAVGIIFGYYPAYKASQLDPVQALTEQ